MDKQQKGYKRSYRPSHKGKSTRASLYRTRYCVESEQDGYGSDSAVSELRSSTAGSEWWSEEAEAGGSLVGIDRDRAVELVLAELVPEPECKMSRNNNSGFSMETFMKMLAEMEENRDRRRTEERGIERERERERERKRAEEREAERERELEREKRSREREDRLVEQLQAQLKVANRGSRTSEGQHTYFASTRP